MTSVERLRLKYLMLAEYDFIKHGKTFGDRRRFRSAGDWEGFDDLRLGEFGLGPACHVNILPVENAASRFGRIIFNKYILPKMA